MFDRIVDLKVKTAIENGEYKNFAGKDQPMRVDKIPHEPDGRGMAYKILRYNLHTPSVMFKRRKLDPQVEVRQDTNKAFISGKGG